MYAHISPIPTARYKKGHRRTDGCHIWAADGSRYALLWNESDPDFVEVRWRHGSFVRSLHEAFAVASGQAR